jgi:hypothetical protein
MMLMAHSFRDLSQRRSSIVDPWIKRFCHSRIMSHQDSCNYMAGTERYRALDKLEDDRGVKALFGTDTAYSAAYRRGRVS